MLVALLTSIVREAPIFRLTVDSSPETGLKVPSQIMADKIMALPHVKCGPVIERLDEGSVVTLNRMLSLVLGLVD